MHRIEHCDVITITIHITLTGGRAGLQSGKEVKIQKRDHLKDMDHSISGRGAETVHRNKDGKRIDPKLEKLKKKEEEKKKAEQDEQFYEWGRGYEFSILCHFNNATV